MTSGFLARLVFLRTRPFAVRSGRHTSIRKSARVVVAWFVVGTITLSGATLVAADIVSPALRDPEYGRRSAALHKRLAENPDRPLVLIVGSSRVGAAICPAAWEEQRTANPGHVDPLLFNMGRA
ncbi:MAG TPA: hypothetical protein VLM40_09260, partial [Gemmata sp.]|nr:hypothetical protein [Gemmata sp.]